MTDPIDYVSEKISLQIKQTNPAETVEVEVMTYALSLIINMLLTIMFVLAVGSLTGKFTETAVVLISFASMRWIAGGGFHLRSLTLCVLVSTALLSVMPHIQFGHPTQLVLSSAFCMGMVLWKSTATWLLKIIAIGIIIAGNFVMEPFIILGCLAHAMLLIPTARKEVKPI
jgi:accessory gene regulator B